MYKMIIYHIFMYYKFVLCVISNTFTYRKNLSQKSYWKRKISN